MAVRCRAGHRHRNIAGDGLVIAVYPYGYSTHLPFTKEMRLLVVHRAIERLPLWRESQTDARNVIGDKQVSPGSTLAGHVAHGGLRS